ncbi:MAG: hypothetical protein WBV45_07425 [Lutimonas sp.]
MKKIVLLLLVLACCAQLEAQEVGLRFGDMDGNNIAIDAVVPIKNTRIHTSVSFGDNVGLDVLYDFVVAPVFKKSGFNYYAGIGLTSLFASDFKLGVMGELGFEYRFRSVPLVAGLDYRPAVIVVDKMDFVYANFGFNFRYVF